jgi:hypothetical protein
MMRAPARAPAAASLAGRASRSGPHVLTIPSRYPAAIELNTRSSGEVFRRGELLKLEQTEGDNKLASCHSTWRLCFTWVPASFGFPRTFSRWAGPDEAGAGPWAYGGVASVRAHVYSEVHFEFPKRDNIHNPVPNHVHAPTRRATLRRAACKLGAVVLAPTARRRRACDRHHQEPPWPD